MKKWMLRAALALVLAFAGLSLCPTPAAASFATPLTAEAGVRPAVTVPKIKPAPDADFSDADFARQDQPELGTLSGGEVVVFVGGGLLLLLLLILLLVWIVR